MKESEMIQAKASLMNQAELRQDIERVRSMIKQTTAERELRRYHRRESILCAELDRRVAAAAQIITKAP